LLTTGLIYFDVRRRNELAVRHDQFRREYLGPGRGASLHSL
jgi:hypothetical protein